MEFRSTSSTTPPHHSAPPVRVNKAVMIGVGTMGFAIAKLFSEKNKNIPFTLIDPNTECIERFNDDHKHPYFHQGVSLPLHVKATTDMEAVKGANLVILCIPGQFVRSCVRDFAGFIENDVIILNVSKAVEKGTNEFFHTVVAEEWRKATREHPHKLYFVALAGGMVPEESTLGWPIAADMACENTIIGKHMKDLFSSQSLKIRLTDDVIGVELAGAFKNVLAIGTGIFDGLGISLSSKAAFISEGSREMRDLAVMLGAKPETFGLGSHAWLGDLITTCFGDSRNRYFGKLIGSGMHVAEAIERLENERKRAEGYLSTKSFYNLARRRGLNTPFLQMLNDVLFEEKSPRKAVEDFFKSEHLSLPPVLSKL